MGDRVLWKVLGGAGCRRPQLEDVPTKSWARFFSPCGSRTELQLCLGGGGEEGCTEGRGFATAVPAPPRPAPPRQAAGMRGIRVRRGPAGFSLPEPRRRIPEMPAGTPSAIAPQRKEGALPPPSVRPATASAIPHGPTPPLWTEARVQREEVKWGTEDVQDAATKAALSGASLLVTPLSAGVLYSYSGFRRETETE